jgi:asparagine synthase (glutamine-hydrolysing)
MCGIAGIVNLTGPTGVDHAIVRRMANAILHRGPDEDGFFFRPGLAMASRRLSIVDLADGRQPVHNEDSSVTVVYNGELFDYPEMRTELIARGHKLRTHCDTELLPHLWEDHGVRMLEKLRGQFAIALWDERHRQVVLARDRFGICPLYWTQQKLPEGEFLLFASEIKALLASGLVPARPDARGINHVFHFFALPGPVTCFVGVNCLLPGRYLRIFAGSGMERPARVEQHVYWQIDFPDRGDEERHDFRRWRSNTRSPLIDDYEAVMKKAVERRLRADVPVVSYLSGGVDSSLLVALATAQLRAQGRESIRVYAISIQDPALDEVRAATQVARHLGLEQVVVDCGRREVLKTYPELIRAAEGPVIDTSCAALLMLARAVHNDGYKVALTGEGADEWFAGYPWYKVHRLLCCLDAIPCLQLSQHVRHAYFRLTNTPEFPWNVTRKVEATIGGPNAWLDLYRLFASSNIRFFSQSMWEQLGDHIPLADLQLNLERARKWHPLNRSLYLGARVMLPGLLLAAKGDRVAMNSSVETRYPFLDEDLFAFTARLHPGWKMRGLRDKLLHRHLAERWLPYPIAWRRKGMFRAPLDSLLTNSPSFVDELLSPQSLRKTGYFDPGAVAHWQRAFRRIRDGSYQRTMVEMGLVGVVATQLWHHIYIDATLADLPAWSPPPVGCPSPSIPATSRQGGS